MPATRRLINQKARGHGIASAPTACKHTVSGSISLPSPGFFSTFPRGTGALSVIGLYLALESGLPSFPRGFTCPVVLRIPLRLLPPFAYRPLTFCGGAFQPLRLNGTSTTYAVLQPRAPNFRLFSDSLAFPRRYSQKKAIGSSQEALGLYLKAPALLAIKLSGSKIGCTVWALPVSLAATAGISFDFSSSGY